MTHLLIALAYIVRNPVRAGICSTLPSAHVRPPRPSLERILDDGSAEAIAAAYEQGYTMPSIARHLGLHPSTVSRRLSRHRAQIKT